MVIIDAILAPYIAAKNVAQSLSPMVLIALIAVVVIVNVVAAKSWKVRRSRLEYSPLL